jgi:NAD(P)H-hydrate epimerase
MLGMETLPEQVFTAAQVRALDKRIIEEFGVPGYKLMNKAGQASLDALNERWPEGRLLVLCGAGNNAGDGYVVARLALESGRAAEVCALVDPEKLAGDAATAYQDYVKAGGVVANWEGELASADAILVDGLLGTGLDRDVEGRFADAVRAINESDRPVVALDIPSGLNADTGRVMGVAVEADVTITFVGLKSGLLTGRGPALTGDLVFDALGAPQEVFDIDGACVRRLRTGLIRECLPKRPRDAHKGLSGHVLVIGGGPGMAGAARLAGESALRSGAGLVSVATLEAHIPAIIGGRPELMALGVVDGADLENLMNRASVIAVGPGLAQTEWSQRMLEIALDSGLPLVVDADALNLLAGNPRTRQDWVLTPHPGEAARLLGVTTADIQSDRLAAAGQLAERFEAVIVLKGAGSIVRQPDGDTWICTHGNPGMAVAGMGDVLTGVIAGIAAQCGDLALAARCGVLAHALAGDDAVAVAGERGLLASDLFPHIRRRLN